MKTLKTSKHLRGWIPDLPDHRDFLYAAVRPVGVRLPKSVDLRAGMSPVENQGQLGSCTANALAGALEFLEIKSGKLLVDLSRLFIYYNERAIEHTISSDSGAMIRDGIKTLAAQGVLIVLLLFALWSHFKPSADDEAETEETVPPEVAARLAELQATAQQLQDRVSTLEKEIESETKPR